MSYVIKELRAFPTELPLREVARYMGMRSDEVSSEISALIEKLLPVFLGEVRCRACWVETSVSISENIIDFGLTKLESKDLARNLEGCSQAVLFAATIGNSVDRRCKSASIVSPSNAVVLDAMGSTAIEWFCDKLCGEFQKFHPGCELRPRFSPGYGDVPLEFQKDLLRILDAQRKIGLTLSGSLMMLPQKSVTAIVGLCPRKTSYDKEVVL